MRMQGGSVDVIRRFFWQNRGIELQHACSCKQSPGKDSHHEAHICGATREPLGRASRTRCVRWHRCSSVFMHVCCPHLQRIALNAVQGGSAALNDLRRRRGCRLRKLVAAVVQRAARLRQHSDGRCQEGGEDDPAPLLLDPSAAAAQGAAEDLALREVAGSQIASRQGVGF